MKSNFQSGLLCLCLLFAIQARLGYAQTAAQPQTATPSTQAPAPEPSSTPADSPQPSSAQTSSTQAPTPLRQAAPFDDGVDNGDGISVEARFFGFPQGHPILRAGKANTENTPADFVLPGWPKYGLGGVVSVPAGKGAILRVYGFQFKTSGSAVLGADRNFFSVGFPAGSAVEERSTVQNLKIAYEYTTYPFTGRFRMKTLWELQYVHIIPDIWIPSTFNSSTTTAVDTNPTARHIIYPSFGLAFEYSANKHLRFTAKSSGFAFPHHAVIWDADANAAVRFGQLEFVAGAMMYHYKTTPLNAYYLKEDLAAGYVGIRWYLFK